MEVKLELYWGQPIHTMKEIQLELMFVGLMGLQMDQEKDA